MIKEPGLKKIVVTFAKRAAAAASMAAFLTVPEVARLAWRAARRNTI